MRDNSFLNGLSGRIVTPLSPDYHEDRQGWNHAIQQYPIVINYCRTARDVANAVRWARRNHVPLRVRSGGHNYEGYSNGDCVLVIDTSEMNGIEVDERASTVWVQGGVTNGQLYRALAERGYPFPGGTCPTVGVSGYALGGGWGLSCRLFGLGCDSIEEVVLVNSCGRLVKTNQNKNPDLFWSCRGAGGGNFGVVVSIKFKLPPRVGSVTLIEIDYRNIDEAIQALFLQTWQTWLEHADRRVTLISRIYNSEADGLGAVVRGIFYGGSTEATALMQPFLNITGAVANIREMSFLEAVNTIGSTYPPFEKFSAASRFVYRYFSPAEVAEITSLIQNRAEGSIYAGISMYALGGKVDDMPQDDTAFFYRGARYIVWLNTQWEDDNSAPANTRWVEEKLQRLAPLTVGAYVNFPYRGLCCCGEEYYGTHLCRLQNIKRKYDPCNVFDFPQGLGRC